MLSIRLMSSLVANLSSAHLFSYSTAVPRSCFVAYCLRSSLAGWPRDVDQNRNPSGVGDICSPKQHPRRL